MSGRRWAIMDPPQGVDTEECEVRVLSGRKALVYSSEVAVVPASDCDALREAISAALERAHAGHPVSSILRRALHDHGGQ